MPEVRRNGPMGAETMKITVVGALAIVAAIIAAVLLIRYLNKTDSQVPDQGSV